MRRISVADARGPGRESSGGEGVEDADLDVDVGTQVQEAPILARGIQVVDEHAHPHAAVRGEAHVIQQCPAGVVLVNDVVLDVERALGMIRQRNEAGQRLFSRGQQADAGKVLGGIFSCDDAPECRGLRMLKGRGRGLVHVPRQTGTPGQHQNRGQWHKGIAHRFILSGRLCAHADPKTHPQFRLESRPHDGGPGARAQRALACVRHRPEGDAAGSCGGVRARGAALPGNRLRGRGSDWGPGGDQSPHRLLRDRGAPIGCRQASAPSATRHAQESAPHLQRRRRCVARSCRGCGVRRDAGVLSRSLAQEAPPQTPPDRRVLCRPRGP